MNITTVKINGMEYNLRGEENNEYLQMIAQYVDNKINSLMMKNSKISRPDATILAAINLGDEVFKNKESYERINENYKVLSREHKELISETQIIKRDFEEIQGEKNGLINEIKTVKAEFQVVSNQLESEDKVANEANLVEKNKLIEEKNSEIESLKKELAIMEEVVVGLKKQSEKQQAFSKKLLKENNGLRYQQMARIRQISEVTDELKEANIKLMKNGQALPIKK